MSAIRRWQRPVPTLRICWGELLLIVALVALALAVRLPYLWDIPRFTDETAEARIGLRIAAGEVFPLTNRDPYIGALWNYVLAAGFAIGGASLFTPRTIIAVLGALTVVPTYLLGRTIGLSVRSCDTDSVCTRDDHDRTLAGLLLALAPAHIVVNSHIAWSNCLTPLFTTLGLWLTTPRWRGGARRCSSGRASSGSASRRTRPDALLLPGVALGVAIARPRWLLGPWPWLAVRRGAARLRQPARGERADGLRGCRAGAAVQAQYTGGEVLTPAVYLDRAPSGGVAAHRQPQWHAGRVRSLSGPLGQSRGIARAGPAAGDGRGGETLARRRALLLLLAPSRTCSCCRSSTAATNRRCRRRAT